MNYQLQYNYCAIIIYVIILVSYLLKKRTKETHNKVFTIIVIVSMIGAIVNVFNTAGNMKILTMPHSLLVFLDYVYFIALNLSPFIYAIYAITLTRKNLRTLNIKGKIMIFAPVTFIWFMLITNPYSHMVFQYVDGVYTRGSSQFIMYVIDLYYVAVGVLYVLREKDSTTLDLKISLAMFFIIGCTMAAIQYVKPEMLVQHLGLSVCELIVLINLQKPEEYLDSQTGAYNRNAFEWIFNMNINAKQNMSILMINIEDMNFLIQTLGLDVEKILIKEIADFLWDVSKGDLYIIDSNSMLIVKGTSDNAVIDEIINKIEKRFDDKWGDLENKIFINYKMMKVRVPEDVSDLDVFYFCHSNFIGLAPTNGNMVEIKNIDFNKAGRRIKVEKIIKRAINEDNFTMYYQLIYSFRDKRIVSAEELIRLFARIFLFKTTSRQRFY